MGKGNKKGSGPIIYSTNPDFKFGDLNPLEDTPPPARQQLRVRIDRKQRAGKTVTLVDGFLGKAGDLELLGRELKSSCGTGGTVKDGQILLQGNYLDQVKKLLVQKGFRLLP
jgi:translation initiation factor 1